MNNSAPSTPSLSLEARLFSRISLVTMTMFFLVLLIQLYLLVVYNSASMKIMAPMVAFILLPMLWTAYRHALKEQVERSVIWNITTWYMICLCMMAVGVRMYAVSLVTAIMPVLLAMPFVSQRILQRIMAISMLLIVAGTIGAEFPPIITPSVPDDTVLLVELFSSALLSIIVMLSMWQSAGQLNTAAAGMRKAIGALQESERLLESKVAARTAELGETNQELELAFQEITNINEIAGIVNSTLDVKVVIDTIYNGLQRMFSFDQMGVFLLNPEDQRLRLDLQAGVAFADELQQALVQDGLPLDETDSFVAASVCRQQTIYIHQVTDEGVRNSGASDKHLYQHGPMESFLLCPLVIENRAIGTIFFVGTEEPFELDSDDIQSIERYVTQLGTAIRNAQLFQQAEKSRAEAEAANQTKGTFLANMSHEIRTPMNAIIGLTGLCLQTELTNKQEDYLTKVDRAANSLRGLIDDILDFSKLEAGKLEFENIPFSLNDVLDNLATICMVRCQNKGLELVFQRDPNLPDTLYGDPTRIGQILINLAGNAIKFTEKGEIVVAIRQTLRDGNRVHVYFDVRDSGIGMTHEQQQRLFKSFSQADSSITRQYGGTGLGLAISQQLTGLMGGEIEVTSAAGVGSSFHFSLDFEVVDEQLTRSSSEEAPSGLNVLVVDDNEASRDILLEYLDSFGYRATLVESGEQALALMRPSHKFDLVLLDWLMPGMTGLDVALAIQDEAKPPKIILMSSWNMPSSEHESMVDAFLPKPIKPSSLHDVIMKAFGKQVERRARSRLQRFSVDDLAPLKGARILVADDSEINLQIACELLEKVPFVMDTAANGEEAVAKVLANHYDCVLMDIQMPLLDGYAATAKIRLQPGYANLPILAMTANVMAEDRARSKASGMNGHIGKPIEPAELFREMANAIAPGDYSANLANQVESAPLPAPESQPLPDALPGLQIKQGLARLAGNETLYLKLLKDLTSQYANCAQTIQQLITEQQFDAVRGLAHKVRGIANNLGAMDVGASAESIESSALAGDSISSQKVADLAQALQILAESIPLLNNAIIPALSSAKLATEAISLLFSRLKQAMEAFDPAAVDLVDQLLAGIDSDGEPAQHLATSREMLDNFNFAAAEPLLAQAEHMLS